jgi:hypothetical protein
MDLNINTLEQQLAQIQRALALKKQQGKDASNIRGMYSSIW